MKYDITNIPLEEIFEPRDGCPICRMKSMLEDNVITYITGAAMMEPDVRIETNKKGFCYDHYAKMLKRRNKLSVALMLESYLELTNKRIFNPLVKDSGKAASEVLSTCFVCESIENNMRNMLINVCVCWEKDKDFRNLLEEQPYICLPHYSELYQIANKTISKKNRKEFFKTIDTLTKQELTELKSDISHFCSMFDYRNSGENADWGNSKDAIERTVHFLSGNILKNE